MNNLQEKVIRAMVEMYGFYSIEELSEMTEVSVSSIKHSLSDIARQIEDYGAKLLRVPRKGICMVATDQQREKIVEKLDFLCQQQSGVDFFTGRIIFWIFFPLSGKLYDSVDFQKNFASAEKLSKEIWRR